MHMRCSLCGGPEVYTAPGGIADSDGYALQVTQVKRTTIFPNQVQIRAYICAECGHVALQVDRDDVGRLAKIFHEGRWTHVKLLPEQGT
jgi:hypothetical protein